MRGEGIVEQNRLFRSHNWEIFKNIFVLVKR